ncbi:MAG: right-handed parallel beta-helix repeat-containing protein [Kofleriaceae bacterium]|nr:right-handed parallel beta-helix repeat-containing protein [Kofleriaceae bacterium]
MANEEKSRDAFLPEKRYAAVGMQQGRVMLDDDFNENERIHLEEERRINLDVIGPVGSPDEGFRISNGALVNGGVDFEIGAGTLYLGGLRLWNPTTAHFNLQDDWLQQADADRKAPTEGQLDLIYVEAWQQPVTATEDTELFEVALGGPDTSTRLRTMWRVQRAIGAGGSDCAGAWTKLVSKWTAEGRGTIDETGERKVDARLEVDYFEGEAGDLCTPAIEGGYLGAENQTIRVQLVDADTFTWGFDNAAPLYQAEVGNAGKTITLATDPRDQAHWPVSGQVIEVLAPSARLPNGEKLADEVGHLARVVKSFDPVTHTIEIDPPVPAGFGTAWLGRSDHDELGGAGFFVRVWDRGDDHTSPLAISIATHAKLGSTGVDVTITGTSRVAGDHWIISARPKTPKTFVPWDLEAPGGRLVHGRRRFFTPLALIRWHADGTFDVLHDCRPPFVPLTRVRGCCTFTVGDRGRFHKIQDAVDALPLDGGKVCVLRGTYAENVFIKNKTNVIIEGCGRQSIVAPGNGKPAFTIEDSTYIEIRDLSIVNPAGQGIVAADTSDAAGLAVSNIVLSDLEIHVRDRSAIDLVNVAQVTIRRNHIAADALAAELFAAATLGREALVFVGGERIEIEHNEITAAITARLSNSPFGGIQIGGGSRDVEIRHNRVQGGSGNAITLGSIVYAPPILITRLHEVGWNALRAKLVRAVAGHWVIVTDQGCVGVDWVPDPPRDDDDGELTPLSEGPVDDVRIIDNDLTDMAFSGIAVARFFSEENLQLITTDRLLVESNRILRNLRCANNPIAERVLDLVAFGAIALADGERVTVRNNVIENNGTSHVDAICGIFMLRAEGISIENNRIVDNGPRTSDTNVGRPGMRGGIVLPRVVPPTSTSDKTPRRGYPAVRIHDNIVSVALGRALHVIGEGGMSISRNQLSSHGIVAGTTRIAGYYTHLADAGLFPIDYVVRATGTAPSSKAQPRHVYFDYTAGTLSGADRWNTDALWDRDLTSAAIGTALLDGLDQIGAATVFVLDLGRAPDLARVDSSIVSTNIGDYNYIAARIGLQRFTRLSGKVEFNDNQVTLDLIGSRETDVLSSLVLLSLDDVSMQDNQVEVIATTAPVLIEALVVAVTARMNGNRINQVQPAAAPLQRLSAMVFGQAAQATSNIATYCIGVRALQSAWRIDANNLELLALNNSEACQIAERYGALVAQYIWYFLVTT